VVTANDGQTVWLKTACRKITARISINIDIVDHKIYNQMDSDV